MRAVVPLVTLDQLTPDFLAGRVVIMTVFGGPDLALTALSPVHRECNESGRGEKTNDYKRPSAHFLRALHCFAMLSVGFRPLLPFLALGVFRFFSHSREERGEFARDQPPSRRRAP